MSRLEELIAELCPDGVEYKKLGEIATITRGGNFQKKAFQDSGVPCIHYGQIYTKYNLFADQTISFIDKQTAEKQKFAEPGDIVMAVTSENVDDVCKCVAWLGSEKIAVSGHTAIIHHKLDPKYLVYYFHSIHFQKQKNKLAHGTKVIEVTPDHLTSISVPVPPLEVQREIVRVLDHFTLLSAELSAELKARKQQFDYYRDVILHSEQAIEYALSEICEIIDCPHSSPKWKDEGIPVIRNFNLVNGQIDTSRLFYVDEEEYRARTKRVEPKEGDILFSREAPIGNVGIVPAGFRCCQGQRVVLLRPNNQLVAPRYLLHYLQCDMVRSQISGIEGKGATVSNFNLADLRRLKLHIPEKQVQLLAVQQLDVFNKVCNDIQQGLPAEIQLRKQQYEHYRNQLLSFKEVSR